MPFTGTPPGVSDFRARFPTFTSTSYPDPLVQLVLNEATLQVDDSWDPQDAFLAIEYLTAHTLKSEQLQGGGTGPGFLTSEHVGPVGYSYDIKLIMQQQMGYFGTTVYGQRYYLLLRQNRTGPFIV